MSDCVREILRWYASENSGVLTNLARLLDYGKLGGSRGSGF
jgi:fructose-bisphosphate aldolase, class I